MLPPLSPSAARLAKRMLVQRLGISTLTQIVPQGYQTIPHALSLFGIVVEVERPDIVVGLAVPAHETETDPVHLVARHHQPPRVREPLIDVLLQGEPSLGQLRGLDGRRFPHRLDQLVHPDLGALRGLSVHWVTLVGVEVFPAGRYHPALGQLPPGPPVLQHRLRLQLLRYVLEVYV